VSKLYIKTIFV